MRLTSGSILFASSTEKLARMRELCAEAVPWSRPRSEPLFCRPLLESTTPALLGCFEATLLVFRFVNQLRNFDWPSVSVDRHKGQVARVRMSAISRLQVFRL